MPGRFSRLGGAGKEPDAGDPPAEPTPGDAPTTELSTPAPAAPVDDPATAVHAAAAPDAAPETEAASEVAVAASEPVADPAPEEAATEPVADPAPEVAVVATEPAPEEAPEPGPTEPGFAERGRLRRRLRHVRQLRELALRDLGGMVFDLHRFERERPDLVTAKLEALAGVDAEMRTLETILGERRELVVLHEAGLTSCAACGTLLGSDARFCSHCATPVGEVPALPPVAVQTPPVAEPAPTPTEP